MIGIEINELTDLKVLTPIISVLVAKKISYVLYVNLMGRGEKSYNVPTKDRINKSSTVILKNAKKFVSFTKYSQLPGLVKRDGVKKLIGIEMALVLKDQVVRLKQQGIKVYSILYLTDSMWGHFNTHRDSIHKIYYSSKYIRDMSGKFCSFKPTTDKDKLLGSPLFDALNSNGKNITVLMPNVKKEDVPSAFGSHNNFKNIMKKIISGNSNIILKSRKKQWMPAEIAKSAKVVYDGDIMYPNTTSNLLNNSYCVVMFYSSGIYEAVVSGNYVVNIEIPVSRWRWGKKNLNTYFKSKLYDFDGVVKNVTQKEILRPDWKFEPKKINANQGVRWVDEFVGPTLSGSFSIVADILAS